MREPVIVDTNVPVAANGRAEHAGLDCQYACIQELIEIQRRGRVLVDESGLIFNEYIRHLSFRGQPGVGDAFFKWLWDRQGDLDVCIKVDIRFDGVDESTFPDFPEDEQLEGFDLSDRKFVAVAIASGENPPILNATDTDWWIFREALENNGVTIQFLCPEQMQG